MEWPTRIVPICEAPSHLNSHLTGGPSLCSYESLQHVDKSMAEGPIYYYVFNTLLITLQVMHIYWWILIWRMIVKQIQDRGKISDDVRSGDLLSFIPSSIFKALPLDFLLCSQKVSKATFAIKVVLISILFMLDLA